MIDPAESHDQSPSLDGRPAIPSDDSARPLGLGAELLVVMMQYKAWWLVPLVIALILVVWLLFHEPPEPQYIYSW